MAGPGEAAPESPRPPADPEPSDVEQRLDGLLARAGELLRGEQVEAADREVAEAIRLAPGDPRAQNLLGLVRFRAGRYHDAWQVYRELCARDPDDSALRLNLGLVELRMGKNAEAAISLRRVVEREPDNLKAQGYLGLALMRGGDLPAAREAFQAAGQSDLVRQVDEQLAAVPRWLGGEAPLDGNDAHVTRPLLVEEEAPRPATPRVTLSVNPPAALPAPVLPLARFLERNRVRAPAGEPFAVGPGGHLLLRIEGRTHLRTAGALASSGRLAFSPLARRGRGRTSEEPIGEGDDAMVIATGTGQMLVGPRGGRFAVLHLTLPDDVLYLREASVFAFEESLSWENGRIPGGGPGALSVLQLRGQGRVVLRSRQAPVTLSLGPAEVLYVEQSALLGWTGQVVPQQLRSGAGEPTQFVACSGEGSLILEEAAPEPEPRPG